MGKEGPFQQLMGGPSVPKVASAIALHWRGPSGQERKQPGDPSQAVGAVTGAAQCRSTAANFQDQLLFQPGVLEALSGAVAARLSASVAALDTVVDNGVFKFSATKNKMQGQLKRKGRREGREGRSERVEDARSKAIGKKRRHIHDVPPTGSDLDFSFEKALDSYERLLYGDVSVSSKRVCTGRVQMMKDVDGAVTHVAKELEEKEEEYVQQEGESVEEENGDNGASAAFEEEARRAK